MNARRPLLSPHPMLCAALTAAALAATGCAAPEDVAPEPVAEAAAPLGDQIAPGLVQLLAYDTIYDATLKGYGYIEPIGAEQTLQRFMIFSNDEGNSLAFGPYDHGLDPEAISEPVSTDLAGFSQLVTTLWDDTDLGEQKIYATCISRVYQHGGTYDGVRWLSLPDEPPHASFPAWLPSRESWMPYTSLDVTPQPSPLVWPPSTSWLLHNAAPLSFQLDPGDGKVWQGMELGNDIEIGQFFTEFGVNYETNIEYVFMQNGYDPAGAENYTRFVDNSPTEWPSLAAFWSSLGTLWQEGTALAINGCVNYHAPTAPSPL